MNAGTSLQGAFGALCRARNGRPFALPPNGRVSAIADRPNFAGRLFRIRLIVVCWRLANTRAKVLPSQLSGEEMCPFLDASCGAFYVGFVLA